MGLINISFAHIIFKERKYMYSMNLNHRINFRCDQDLFNLIKENYTLFLKTTYKHITFGEYIRRLIHASLCGESNEN